MAILLVVLALLVPFHAYLLYPLSLRVLAWLRRDADAHGTAEDTPTVTLVISAYNEERWIRAKIENSLGLDYPVDRLRILVVSDGSSDATNAIVREYAARGVELAAFEGRRGKVACLNEAVAALRTDLAVMSDANSIYDRDALRRLVRHFRDPRVGCVCGRLAYHNPREQAAGDGEKVYWSYEGWIKRLESRLGSLLGANGAIYAYRRELFRPVDPLMFCDDVIPIRIAVGGRLVIYDPEAWCSEETADEGTEMRRRRRHASFGMRSMARVIVEALAARRWLLVYQALSHRVLRWMGGPALLVMAGATPFLPAPVRLPMATVQLAFYACAVAGGLLARLGWRRNPAYLAYYIIVIHLAGLAGLGRLLLGKDAPYWEPRQ